MNIGYALREARLRKFPNKEKSQGEIAKLAGIKQTYLSMLESGKRTPSIEVLQSLCKIYGMPPVVLFWMAMEPSDVKKSKREMFQVIEGPMRNLINEIF